MEIANVVASTSIQTALNRDTLLCLNTGFGVKSCLLKKIVIDHVAPGLSSIPLIGRAFQSSQRRAFKSELLLFITPRVL